jgi:hypothetical protein
MSYDPRRRRRASRRRRRYDFGPDFDPRRRLRLRRPSPAILKGWIKPVLAGLVGYAFGEKLAKSAMATADEGLLKFKDAQGNEQIIMTKAQGVGILGGAVSGALFGGRSKIVKNAGLGALGSAIWYVYDKFFHKG